jgi:CRP/FNR family cyclic AMP-dependent transcriptional regulator
MKEIVELFRRTELFAGLPEDKIRQIVATGRLQTFDAGATIIAEGEPSDELYVVQKGMVEVLLPGGASPDIPWSLELAPVVQLGRGQVFGEMALVDQGARSATVRSVEDGTALFVVPRDAFWELCEADHHIGYIVMRNLARDLSFKLRLRNLREMAGG